MHPSSTGSQGVVKLWVEINPVQGSNRNQSVAERVWNIKPRPSKDYEVRVVVWDTKEIVAKDIEGTSDVFIKAFFDPKQAKDTDTHFRCSNGMASFNYRMMYNMKAPYPNDQYIFTVQAWDKDLFASNDLIGEA